MFLSEAPGDTESPQSTRGQREKTTRSGCLGDGRVTENFLEIPEGMGEGYLPHVLENGISGDVAGSSEKALACKSSRSWPGLHGGLQVQPQSHQQTSR